MPQYRLIKVDELREFGAAPSLDGAEGIAAYVTGIPESNDAGVLAGALGEIACARGMTEMARNGGGDAGPQISGRESAEAKGRVGVATELEASATGPLRPCVRRDAACRHVRGLGPRHRRSGP
ncbi:MAG: hypothetical protein M0T84_00785 [Betaproteobacteria bacterium]|nr:hypothetical protein [Betaproteobacteria bacterium]